MAFACATASWAFRVNDFAEIISKKLGMNEKALRRALWAYDKGDYYYNPKEKSVSRNDMDGRLKPMFVQFVLDQIWAVYGALVLEPDEERARRIVTALSLKVSERELKHSNREEALRFIMSRWLPLADALLAMMVEQVPSPMSCFL